MLQTPAAEGMFANSPSHLPRTVAAHGWTRGIGHFYRCCPTRAVHLAALQARAYSGIPCPGSRASIGGRGGGDRLHYEPNRHTWSLHSISAYSPPLTHYASEQNAEDAERYMVVALLVAVRLVTRRMSNIHDMSGMKPSGNSAVDGRQWSV